MRYAPGNHEGPNRDDKGQLGGSCNVTACQLPASAFYFNHSTKAYYCRVCAAAINNSNTDDAMRLYGHELCTPVELHDCIIKVKGYKWKVRFATSYHAALSDITHARITGSTRSMTTVNGVTRCDVVRLNEDGSEVAPYILVSNV